MQTFLIGEDFPSLASKQAELSCGLAKNLSNAQKPKHLEPLKRCNVLRAQITSLSKRQTDQKQLLVFSPQEGLLKPRLNNYLERWMEIT